MCCGLQAKARQRRSSKHLSIVANSIKKQKLILQNSSCRIAGLRTSLRTEKWKQPNPLLLLFCWISRVVSCFQLISPTNYLHDGKYAKCKTHPFLLQGTGAVVGRRGRLGSFIVMQRNATIKNIILEDVSSLITHRASSKLSSW